MITPPTLITKSVSNGTVANLDIDSLMAGSFKTAAEVQQSAEPPATPVTAETMDHATVAPKNTADELIADLAAIDGDEGKRNKPKQSDMLFRLVNERAQLFTAQDGERFARVPIDEHYECYGLTSKAFREYLDGLYFVNHASIPSAQAKQDAIGLLSFHARANKQTVFYRSGHHNGKIYLDMGTEEWSTIEIDGSGYRTIKVSPVMFRRASATKPLPTPATHDDLKLILDHVNISQKDWPLFSAWLVAAVMPLQPTPILTFPNEQGTGKTANTNRLKSLLDPGKGRVMPREVRDLMVMADSNWCVAFDNVSSIPPDIADALCQIVTGGEYSKRMNYADKDEAIMQVRRPIIINGIGNITSDRADLLQRSLLIRPPVIPKEKRVDERTADERFEADRPRIFGALLSEVSRVLRTLPTVKLPELPRMADFALIGYAMHGQPFLDAYYANIENAVGGAAESSTLVEAIKQLVDRAAFEGPAQRLFDSLNSLPDAEKFQRSKEWPKSNRVIKNNIQRVAPLLRGIGINVDMDENRLGTTYKIGKVLY